MDFHGYVYATAGRCNRIARLECRYAPITVMLNRESKHFMGVVVVVVLIFIVFIFYYAFFMSQAIYLLFFLILWHFLLLSRLYALMLFY